MIPLFDRVTSRITGLAVDIFKPRPEDGEWWILAKELNVKFIFQCTVHKTIVGGNQFKSALKQSKDPSHWCKGCAIEAERFANALVYDEPCSTGYNLKKPRGIKGERYQNEFAFKDNGLLKDINGNKILPRIFERAKPSV